ncbi:MAG: hypothetical protein M1828_005572 [Chrysothrix sp. TS-e1954]|nr:MAG: hypothetical protein M1828_005572 [Chrysothrix sp. TS-e1954]
MSLLLNCPNEVITRIVKETLEIIHEKHEKPANQLETKHNHRRRPHYTYNLRMEELPDNVEHPAAKPERNLMPCMSCWAGCDHVHEEMREMFQTVFTVTLTCRKLHAVASFAFKEFHNKTILGAVNVELPKYDALKREYFLAQHSAEQQMFDDEAEFATAEKKLLTLSSQCCQLAHRLRHLDRYQYTLKSAQVIIWHSIRNWSEIDLTRIKLPNVIAHRAHEAARAGRLGHPFLGNIRQMAHTRMRREIQEVKDENERLARAREQAQLS